MQSSVCFAAALALAGCPGREPVPACTTVDTTCAPLYPPTTFANVYGMTMSRSCGTTKGSCHSSSGAAGISYATEQEAYDNLLARDVMPGDPACSQLVVRTSMTGHDYTMPRGSSLVPAERCAILQWVQAGADP